MTTNNAIIIKANYPDRIRIIASLDEFGIVEGFINLMDCKGNFSRTLMYYDSLGKTREEMIRKLTIICEEIMNA